MSWYLGKNSDNSPMGIKIQLKWSSNEHRLPWTKSIKSLQFNNGNFYNSNIVCNITNDIFYVYEKIVYNFNMGLNKKSSS